MLDFSPAKLFTVANFISALRIILVPFIGWFLFLDTTSGMLWAGALLVLAIATDLLDGLAARLLGQVSDLGKIIDPLADKLFVIFTVALFIFLRDFPLWIALLILIKDLLIVGASALVIGRRKLVMASNLIGKYAFAFQAGLVLSYFLRFPFGIDMFTIGTLVFIFLSLASYAWTLQRVLQSPEGEVIVGRERWPAWVTAARRAGVAFLALLWFTNLWFWAFEDAASLEGRETVQRIQIQGAEELLTRYAPVLEFAPDGRQPLDPGQVYEAAIIRSGPRYLFGLFSGSVDPSADRREAAGGESWIQLNPNVNGEPVVNACAFTLGEEEGKGEARTILMYWLLFAEESLPVARSGDWELIMITLDAADNPVWLTTTRGWAAVTNGWNDLECEGERPVIWIGRRSNAPTTVAGTVALFLEAERIIGAGEDEAPGGERLAPAVGYQLEIMGGYLEQWHNWEGYWGGPQPGGDRGPILWTSKRAAPSPWDHPISFMRSGLPSPAISAR